MGKYNTDWTEEKYKRFIEEGRGQGRLDKYLPWLDVRSFPSKGRVSRVFSWKTRRIHHLLTDSNTRYFYLLEWEPQVVDIREHYPLLNLEETIKEKDDINFDVFKDKKSGCQYILTTTFLITLKDEKGNERELARNIKTSSELEKRLTMEKLELERRYWEAKGINWGIVTQRDIPIVKARNIEWIHSSLYDYNERGLDSKDMKLLCKLFIERMKNRQQSIREFTNSYDKESKLEAGTGLFIFKHLIASRQITVDMNKDINLNELISNVQVNVKQERREDEVV